MKILVILLFIFSSFQIYCQDSLNLKFAINALGFQRNFVEPISSLPTIEGEKYRLWYYGIELLKPFQLSKNINSALTASYMRTFPSRWSFIDENQKEIRKKVRAELYSLKASVAFKANAIDLIPIIGIHMDQLYLANANINSQLKFGYGITIGYSKPVNLFKTQILLPYLQVYKIKDVQWIWAIQVPLFYVK